MAFVHQYHQNKLDPRSIKCIFVGYSPRQKGYICYSPTLRKFFTSMDVTFDESNPFYSQPVIEGENANTLSQPQSQVWDTLCDLSPHIQQPNNNETYLPNHGIDMLSTDPETSNHDLGNAQTQDSQESSRNTMP